MKRQRCLSLCVTLMIALMLTCIPVESVFAVKSEVNPPSQTTTFSSSDTFSDDCCKASVKGKTMTVKFKTMIPSYEFRIAFYGVDPKTGVHNPEIYIPAKQVATSSIGRPVYGFEYTLNFEDLNLPDGDYFLYLSKKKTVFDEYEKTPSSGALYKNMVFRLKKDTPKILRYNDVIEENNRVMAIGEDYDPNWYLDETLSDIRFVLRDPASQVYEDMTSYQISFMRRMSDQITAGASSDYDKLLKLYEYVTSEFYYDSVAFSTHSYQYAHPYKNLYNHVNKISGPNSDSQGRVATTCQGYSAIFVSMARAQGIPSRFVFGHRATSPLNNWATEQDIKVKDHWWAECYVNGRWIFVDPTIGTNNKWNKTTNNWQYFGLTNYTYFDPSKEQIAVSHIYHNIYPEKRYGYLITDEEEISKLRSFLEQKSGGRRNGAIMNPNYDKNDLKTWGDGYKAHFMGNGYGDTSVIQWSNKGFTNSVDFSGFDKLKTLSMHHNKLEDADLSNCRSLENVYLYNNNLDYVDLSNCTNLKLASITTDNALKEARIYANKKNVYISSGNNGAFQIKYNAENRLKLEVRFRPDIGYKVGGFYNGNGDKVTSSKSYFMNPGWRTYNVRFVLDPGSFRYYLYKGNNSGTVKEYNRAAQKRLIALGYMEKGSDDGIFDEEMEEAVKVFQRVHTTDPADGEIGSVTWSQLFSTKASKKPSDEVIESIMEINSLQLTAKAAASKGKVVLTWANKDTGTDFGTDSAIDAKPETIQPDGYQVWKSTRSKSDFKQIGTTKNLKFTNKSGLKKGTRYYYKVRAYKAINGRVYFGQWAEANVKAK